MKNITTYYSSRKNIFVWLAALLGLISAVARIIAFGDAVSQGFGVMVVHLLFPLAANLIISIRLPLRCGDMYYVTVVPTVLLVIYFIVRVCELGVSVTMTICCLIFCALQGLSFIFTYTGRMNSQIPALIVWLAPSAFFADPYFRAYFAMYVNGAFSMVLTDIAAWACIICVILASKRMPEIADGEPYRKRFGDRVDGRRLRTLPIMNNLIGLFLPTRVGAQNYIADSVEISNAERYIHEKRREGLKHFGMTHLFLAAYCRCVAEYPALNRYMAGNKIYNRDSIICSMIIKKEMSADSPDTNIKVSLDPSDTAEDVYNKFNELVQANKETETLDNSYDKAASVFNKMPNIITLILIYIIRAIDYIWGLLPVLYKASPFHASMFITSMGSLGIPPIFHHLYDFGNVSQFCAFGAKKTVREINSEGELVSKKYIDYTWVTDERVCDGFYYAAVFKKMKYIINHPDVLDLPPEEVKQDID